MPTDQEKWKEKKKANRVFSCIEKFSQVDRAQFGAQGHPGVDLITTT